MPVSHGEDAGEMRRFHRQDGKTLAFAQQRHAVQGRIGPHFSKGNQAGESFDEADVHQFIAGRQ